MIISACVMGRQKPLLARQFVEIPRVRIEALLNAFLKLVQHAGTDHTYVESDCVRYVYQPLESLYLVLVTTKQSNILEDLHTLRVFATIVQDACAAEGLSGSVDVEQVILDNVFPILFMVDELVSFGLREAVTLSQLRSYRDMDSNEEKLQKLLTENKEKEEKERRRQIALRLDKERAAMSKSSHKQRMLLGIGGLGGGGIGGGGMGGETLIGSAHNFSSETSLLLGNNNDTVGSGRLLLSSNSSSSGGGGAGGATPTTTTGGGGGFGDTYYYGDAMMSAGSAAPIIGGGGGGGVGGGSGSGGAGVGGRGMRLGPQRTQTPQQRSGQQQQQQQQQHASNLAAALLLPSSAGGAAMTTTTTNTIADYFGGDASSFSTTITRPGGDSGSGGGAAAAASGIGGGVELPAGSAAAGGLAAARDAVRALAAVAGATSATTDTDFAAALRNPLAEPVQALVEEKVKGVLHAEGGVEELDIQGTLFVSVLDTARAGLATFRISPEDSRFRVKVHPNLNKTSYQQQSILELRDASRAYAASTPVAILKWRLQTKDEILRVEAGEVEHDGCALHWRLPQMSSSGSSSRGGGGGEGREGGGGEGKVPVSATLEFFASTDIKTLLPFSVDFYVTQSLCDIDVFECFHMTKKEIIPYTLTRRTEYSVTVHA